MLWECIQVSLQMHNGVDQVSGPGQVSLHCPILPEPALLLSAEVDFKFCPSYKYRPNTQCLSVSSRKGLRRGAHLVQSPLWKHLTSLWKLLLFILKEARGLFFFLMKSIWLNVGKLHNAEEQWEENEIIYDPTTPRKPQ